MIHPRLERACACYCGELRNTHKKQRRYLSHDGKAKLFWDLPKCAVACCGPQNKIYKDFSKPVRTDTYDKVPILKSELLKYVPPRGKIGDITILPNCGNQVGRCAEPHAAKRCMMDEPRIAINDLSFSVARDIATGEPMNPCAICMAVFATIK